MYTIPKIHKSLVNPPGRPIVSGIGSVLEPLSRFADAFLRPMVQKTSTYLKDTKDILILLEGITFDTTKQLLISCDVESLYTSLPQDETLTIIEDVLFEDDWEYMTPRNVVMECCSLALKETFFEYEKTLFLQKHGTSMGSTFAPSIAGLYVHHLEKTRILNTINPFHEHINVWKRFIDDIFIIWNGDEKSAKQFITWLNCQDDFLKFTSTSPMKL